MSVIGRYSFSEFISNMYAYVGTKLFYRSARFIRRPFYIRGRKSLNSYSGLTTGHSCRFDLEGKKPTLFIGCNCEFGDNTHIVAYNRVRIGNNVLIASKVFISDTDHGIYDGMCSSNPLEHPNDRKIATKEVEIEDDVWIGENAVILAGSKIGKGVIIGANAVVKGEIAPFTIAVGQPAKIVKKFNFEKNVWERV